MKAIVIEPHSAVWPGVDSAILRAGEPVFIAEPTAAWQCRIIPAVRIARLGMHISPKNVHRHIDAISAFHVTTPAAPCDDIPAGLIDRTFSPGAWIPLDAADYASTMFLGVARGPIGAPISEELSVEFSPDSLKMAQEISRLSQMCTFRSGDIILFAGAAIDLGSPRLDTYVKATLNGMDILNIRIK